MSQTSRGGPLSGVRVVDFSTALAGPLAAGMLGDLGADVVKLEPLGFGDVLRYIGPSIASVSGPYLAANRTKRAAAVNLKDPEGLAIALELVRSADIVFQNFRPGVADRLGIGYEDLKAQKEDIILVAISGYGPAGPWSDRPAYDGVIQGLSGLAMIEADEETGKPHNLRHTASDKLAALFASQAALAALAARDRGAGGQIVHVPLLQSSVAFLWVDGTGREALADYDGFQMSNPGAHVKPLECSDGWIYIVAAMPDQFTGMCAALEVAQENNEDTDEAGGQKAGTADAETAEAETRMGITPETWQRCYEALRKLTVAEACARLDAHDVPAGPAVAPGDVPSLEQLAATGFFVEADHSVAGRVVQARHPATFENTPTTSATDAPHHGRDTKALLAEIGRDDYDDLAERGVVE